MRDIVTFETAVRLKESGFPQPTPEAGQFWYNNYKAVTIIYKKEVSDFGGLVYFNCTSMDSGRSEKMVPAFENAFFAPTATDILRELKSDFDISCLEDGNWMVIKRETADQLTPIAHFTYENPAEVAAEAWLNLR